MEKLSEALPPKVQMECQRCKAPFQALTHPKALARYLRVPTLCPKCREDEVQSLAQREEKQYQREVALAKETWVTSVVPRHFLGKVFETFLQARQQVAFDAALQYAQSFPLESALIRDHRSLVFWSRSPGVGKTHLVCAIVQHLLDRWPSSSSCPVEFWEAGKLATSVEAARRFSSGEDRELFFRRRASIPLLVLDDVGKEGVNREMQEVYYRVVNDRYTMGRPMVVTANADPYVSPLLGDILGEASWSRLQEMCHGAVYNMTGEDYRQDF